MKALVQGVLQGERRALARLLTQIENRREGSDDALAALFPHTGRAHLIGVTGAPGAGKSTLVTALAKALRGRGQSVAILCVDPTSPFTGGAILGDRIRMADLAGDSGVFIRSMATRGSLGGVASATRDAARVLDAAGFDIVLIETVGAGQSEVEIARIAQTVIVVEAPGMGDDVQAIKAGILEIADLLVVNKADNPGVDNTVRALKMMLELGHPVNGQMRHHGHLMTVDFPDAPNEDFWMPRLVKTTAINGQGIDDLLLAVDAHQAWLRDRDRFPQFESAQIRNELLERVRDSLFARWLAEHNAEEIEAVSRRVQARTIAPHDAVANLVVAPKAQSV
jgi:LAO/AO transport system kinase